MNLTNEFLIAMPSLEDPNFARTVTYVYAHDESGAMGLVINRPIEVRFSELLDHMGIESTTEDAFDTPVVMGGPVDVQRGFVIHEPVGDWDAMVQVSDDMAISSSRDVLAAMATGTGPTRAIVALGYAGWGPGQLENEVLENSWLNGPSAPEVIFDLPFDERWGRAASLMGVDLDRLSSLAGHS
jgi:putative transcriptional regulator